MMEQGWENRSSSRGIARDMDAVETTDPFQNRRLSQVVAQIFESTTCINQLETCDSCEEEGDVDDRQGDVPCCHDDQIETDFIHYKEEPKNKELFRETFREIEAFFSRESPVRVKVTDTDLEDSLSELSAITDLIEKKELELEDKVDDSIEKEIPENKAGNVDETKVGTEVEKPCENAATVAKRETEISDIENNVVVIGNSVVQLRRPVKRFAKDYDFPPIGGANSSMQQHVRHSTVQYSNLCGVTKPMLTNSSIETTFGVTPPEQRSNLRSIRRARSPDCKRVSPTFRWSVTSV